jgi:hypothetical protein
MECCRAGLPERRTNCRSERRSVKEGLNVVRLKVPAGYKVLAHVHPNDEHVTVISGTFNIGMGDNLDEKKRSALKVGGAGLTPPLVPIPFAVWRPLAWAFEMLTSPLLTRNRVELMQIDTVASPEMPGFSELGISPHPVEAALQKMLPNCG